MERLDSDQLCVGIARQESRREIGILDIYGFERLERGLPILQTCRGT